jgi:N-acyl-D-amino-acid deacylase
LAVGERTGIPVQLSHHKAEGAKNWGKVRLTLARIAQARESGLDVLGDLYPYTAYMTGLSTIVLPQWAAAGSPEEITARLTAPETRARVLAEIDDDPPHWESVIVVSARERRETQGLSILKIAQMEGRSPSETALNLLADEHGWIGAVYFAIDEADVEFVLRDPHIMIGSDGATASPAGILGEDRSHPRTYGTFPRVLSLYVRDKGVISLQEAIRRMTSLPASRLRLEDRGVLREGMKADITIFDAGKVHDDATFDEPHRFASGIEHVLVNGRFALRDGELQAHTRAGAVLRRA